MRIFILTKQFEDSETYILLFIGGLFLVWLYVKVIDLYTGESGME